MPEDTELLIRYTFNFKGLVLFMCPAHISLHVRKPFESSRVHVASVLYDNTIVTMHVCTAGFSAKSPFSLQYVCYALVSLLFSLKLLDHDLFVCFCTAPLSLPWSLAANPLPLIYLHETVTHIQSHLVMKTHKIHANLLHVKGFHMAVISLLCTLSL